MMMRERPFLLREEEEEEEEEEEHSATHRRESAFICERGIIMGDNVLWIFRLETKQREECLFSFTNPLSGMFRVSCPAYLISHTRPSPISDSMRMVSRRTRTARH